MRRLDRVMFETDTPAGRAFDVVLLWAILLNVALVVLESVAAIRARYGPLLRLAEWIFTVMFTIEYVLRILAARRRRRYVTSFYGIIDLLAVLPSYLSLFFVGTQYFIVLRSLRLLRVFRIFKLSRYLGEAGFLAQALQASRAKITVFLTAVVTLVLCIGAVMYLVEGPRNGFDDIPVSIYWAVVTLTTVGYGDIAPQTPLGKFLASAVMILGYSIIAVPTGIVTTELSLAYARRDRVERPCPDCGTRLHEEDAVFCRRCGARLPRRRDAEAVRG